MKQGERDYETENRRKEGRVSRWCPVLGKARRWNMACWLREASRWFLQPGGHCWTPTGTAGPAEGLALPPPHDSSLPQLSPPVTRRSPRSGWAQLWVLRLHTGWEALRAHLLWSQEASLSLVHDPRSHRGRQGISGGQ